MLWIVWCIGSYFSIVLGCLMEGSHHVWWPKVLIGRGGGSSLLVLGLGPTNFAIKKIIFQEAITS